MYGLRFRLIFWPGKIRVAPEASLPQSVADYDRRSVLLLSPGKSMRPAAGTRLSAAKRFVLNQVTLTLWVAYPGAGQVKVELHP
jgi:hypothetical protein